MDVSAGVGMGMGRGFWPSYGLFAANPPEGCTASWGGEGQDGRSYAEQVRYVRDGFRNHRLGRFSMDEMRERVLALRREDAWTPARPTAIVLDGVAVGGTRKDFPDCSVALFEPSGLRVHCVATAERLAALTLCPPAGQRVVTGR